MKETLTKTLKENKWRITLQVILIFINMYLLTIPPKIIGNVIDLLYNISENQKLIYQNIFYLLGVSILILIVRTAWKYFDTVVPRTIEKRLKDALFSQFTKLKIEKIHNIKNGEIMSYFAKDVNEIRATIWRILSFGTRIVATVIIACVTMASGVDLKLTIVTMLPIIITCFIIVKIKKYVEINFKKAQANFTDMSEYVQESTDSIRTTKAYSCEGSQIKEFIRKNRMVRSSNNAVDVFSTLLSNTVTICFGLCYGISILYGSQLVLEGKITIGDFVAFNGYIGLFVGPVSWIPSLIARWKRGQIAYHRLEKVFELEKEKRMPIKEEKQEILGKISFQHLTFHYPGYIDEALEDINLEIKQGETIGIIGTIGSGKTTIVNLLLKLYEVDRNQIFIDDKDINDIPVEQIRKYICCITQENFLFSTTLKENIKLFKDEYKEKEIENSTKEAMIHDEIMEMPEKLNTIIGERGVDLSGGQKQRVVISRAFLNRSNIIIFDDTFSALDNRTEQKLLKNIKNLVKGKTCIIISNRISDVKIADKIIVLDEGKIKETGNHDSLIGQKGMYYTFYQEQASQNELLS